MNFPPTLESLLLGRSILFLESNLTGVKMDTQKIIQTQYLASQVMFEQVIVKCPAARWNAPGNQDIYRAHENIALDWAGMQSD
jgi:hypothetical protein